MNNIFSALPDNLDSEVFEQLLSNETLKIERIISKGHCSPEDRWYDQDTHEWVMVLQGEAKLVFENSAEVHLKTGDYMNIPAHTRHRVSWTPQDRVTLWLAVHY